MVRLLGAMLILGAALWSGAYFAMKERYRLQELEELERAMIYLQGQISYLSAPLETAMEDISRRTNGQIGAVFQQIAEKLECRQGGTAEEIWRAVWLKEMGHTFLSAEDVEEVLLLGNSLGYLDKTRQENSIRLFLRYAEAALLQGRKRLEKNGRLYYGISGLSGLLVVVTLL